MKMMKFVLAAVAFAGFFGFEKSARSQLVFNIQETTTGVELTGSGSFHFGIGFSVQDTPAGESMFPSFGLLEVGPTVPKFGIFQNAITSGPGSFGPGSFAIGGTSSGDTFGFTANQKHVKLPFNYVSGAHLSGQTTWAGATLTSLGVTPGQYNWTTVSGGINDSIRLNVSAVPEASPLTLGAITAAVAGLVTYYRRRRVTA